ncbi:putative protease [Lachnospiraceae bacterium G41]|nr:putative protease [Lachnospiraceae bacterium G41]
MVELLSPAGEYSSFLGAINAGADAVYLAGNMYGARASAVNFSNEELIKAIRYAHLFNRKVFLTVNTLTKNNELENLRDFLNPLYQSGLDAVIVQDIGVFKYIKDTFKDLDIHVSTQAVVTSKYGAEFYKKLGAARVVLARELTLPEVKEITSTGIETECFIHGAMCYSYSGMCLFSSFLGGNSGNRGRCKGPCRQPYVLGNANKEEYLLSLSDMNTVEIIDRLINAGIYSFKIEGRLKSPSYAAGVTAIYRKYIDFCLENPGKELIISEEDKNILKTLYSRTSTGTGYYDRVSSRKMVTIEKGAYAKVDDALEKKIIEKYINTPLKQKIDFKFKAIPNEKAELKVKTVINNIEFKAEVTSEELIDMAQKVATSKEDIIKQLKKLGNTDFELDKCEITIDNSFVPSSLVNKLRREAVDLLEIEIFNANLNKQTLIENESIKSNGLFDSEKYSESNDLVNSEDINQIFDNNKNIVNKRAFVKSIEQLNFALNNIFYDSVVVNKDLINNPEAKSLMNDCSKPIYIELPPVLRSLNQSEFQELIDYASNNDAIKGVYANQYDAYELLKKKGFKKEICSNANIYSYNNLSASISSKLFDEITAPLELNFYDIPEINKSFSYMIYGRAPLMHTANCVLKTTGKCQKCLPNKESFVNLKDRLGVDFKVYTACDNNLCFNTIYNSKPTSLHKYYNRLKEKGVNTCIFSFTDENTDDLERITNFFEDVFAGKNTEPPYDFTAFHMKNGIL